MSRLILAVMVSSALAACAGLPSSGPTSKQILQASASPEHVSRYRVVNIDPAVAGVVGRMATSPSASRFSRLGRAQRNGGIGIGDQVAVTIFESTAGGLFAPQADETTSGAPHVNLPPQVVGRSGTITVPYAGAIPVLGKSPQQIQKNIERKLAKRAIEPQAMVTVVNNDSKLVTITGDVEKGGRIPLSLGNEKVLDVLALSGGARGEAHDTYVKLTRGSRASTMLLADLVNSPTDNVAIQPGDEVFVYRKAQKFVALGANNLNSEVNFGAPELSLSEAIGKAGGLDDRRSDPAGVFVFRYEDPQTYTELTGQSAPAQAGIPLVYQLDLKRPSSFLAAQRFPVKDKDVIYFANSPSTELSKFLGLIGSGVGVANGGATTVIRVAN